MKISLFLLAIMYTGLVSAQYSTKNLDQMFGYTVPLTAKKTIPNPALDSAIKIGLNIDSYNDSARTEAVKRLLQQKATILTSDSEEQIKKGKLDSLDKEIAKTKYTYRRYYRDLKVIKQEMNNGHAKFFFPSLHGRESLRFYEGDSAHIKLFRNNIVNYSPANEQMVLNTEVINDYFGPIRIGLGVQLKSKSNTDSLSTPDSTKMLQMATDVASDLKNKGGDINLGLSFPFLQVGVGTSFFSLRSSIFNNLGFSLPVIGEATNDFTLTNFSGLNAAIYTGGILGKISMVIDASTGMVNGNKNFNQAVKGIDATNPTSFALTKISVGLDFDDAYRMQVDLFAGNSFVRKNFPATISFILRPDKK